LIDRRRIIERSLPPAPSPSPNPARLRESDAA
jgi:hypothetical protein